MKFWSGEKFGRYVIIGLEKGDLLLESIMEALKEYDIKNAIVTSGISATNRMCWHHINGFTDEPADTDYVHEAPMEVGGISGLVLDGVPHLHITFADHDKAWAEHLNEGCRVQYVGEISLIELLDVNLTRVADEYGVKKIADKVE